MLDTDTTSGLRGTHSNSSLCSSLPTPTGAPTGRHRYRGLTGNNWARYCRILDPLTLTLTLFTNVPEKAHHQVQPAFGDL